jgi:hypothetical protein
VRSIGDFVVRDPDHVVAASYASMITLNRTFIDYLSPYMRKLYSSAHEIYFFVGAPATQLTMSSVADPASGKIVATFRCFGCGRA